MYSSHPLFSVHSEALQIFFYFDEYNPLGSKWKIHKISELCVPCVCVCVSVCMHVIKEKPVMCIFYFTIGNVSPKFRSKLSSIQLVAIALHSDLSTYGMYAILKPFVDDVLKLVSIVCATCTWVKFSP